MVSPPEWWPGCGGDKTPVCNGAFIKGRDAETVPCRIPEGVGDSLQAQSWDPALESPGICRNMNYLNLLRISPSLSLSGFKCLDSSSPACRPGYHSLSEAIRLHIVTLF